MFRVKNNVPEIYVNESRDFQLLGRYKDLIFGGVKYNIDSLRHTSNTLEINNNLLQLLKSKLGFFEYEELDETQLRYLLNAFPYIVRNKGSKRGIEYAVYLWFRMYQLRGDLIAIEFDNSTYEIVINVNTPPTSTAILDLIFKYILPTGYSVIYRFAENIEHQSAYVHSELLNTMDISSEENAYIRRNVSEFTETSLFDNPELANNVVNTVGMTRVAEIESIEEDTNE